MELAIGPLLFNWPAERVEAFYARIADEAPVETVYLGEVVCGKRQPLLQDVLARAAERLEAAGKTVIWSTLALPSTPRERRLASELAADPDHLIEAGDMSAVWSRAPAPFVAGPLLNVYNAPAAAELVRMGCVRLCANVELPLTSIAEIAQACPELELELFAFGRLPLALSSRCAQARMEGLHRDACRYVCGDTSCTGCSLKSQCTPSVERRVTRWEHEAVIDALQARMDPAPRAMRTRRRLVEHPFGTIKAWMSHTHFLMKRLPNVKTEISLHILAYNMKRVMAVLGTKPLMEAIRA
jgi:hypothetical protein